MLSIVMERVPGRSKYVVLKYLRIGLIDFEHIEDTDMRVIAKWSLRVWRIREQISEFEQVRLRSRR